MGYEFYADEPVREAVVRNAREQLDRAVGELSERIGEDPEDAVHSARKAIKQERSLLRLARGAMSPRERRRENASLRDAARGLSGARDADVMIATVNKLAERYVGQLPATTFDAVREQFEQRRGERSGSALDARAVQELGAVRLRVDDWQLRRGGWRAIEPGLARSYKDGLKAFGRARSSRTVEDLHHWRKRVKDLWYHSRLLAPACGPQVHGQAKDAHRLSELLGDDHDLGVLREALTSGELAVAADVDAVVLLVDHRRDELQAEAFHVGERVYAESPQAFLRRMRRSWEAGRAVARAAAEQRPSELAEATRVPRHAGDVSGGA
ncbi:MAG: CHAD domain-containing protein [Solirubrobacterales bacterium]|nr:CHAD domain-containing protein [Solirubrobacterales bacterium]